MAPAKSGNNGSALDEEQRQAYNQTLIAHRSGKLSDFFEKKLSNPVEYRQHMYNTMLVAMSEMSKPNQNPDLHARVFGEVMAIYRANKSKLGGQLTSGQWDGIKSYVDEARDRKGLRAIQKAALAAVRLPIVEEHKARFQTSTAPELDNKTPSHLERFRKVLSHVLKTRGRV